MTNIEDVIQVVEDNGVSIRVYKIVSYHAGDSLDPMTTIQIDTSDYTDAELWEE